MWVQISSNAMSIVGQFSVPYIRIDVVPTTRSYYMVTHYNSLREIIQTVKNNVNDHLCEVEQFCVIHIRPHGTKQ